MSATEETSEKQSGEKRTCNFYLPKKKRTCRMLVAEGNDLCGQHLVDGEDKSGRGYKRIPCPLDPKHSCYEHRLHLHLLSCNAKEDDSSPFRCTNINIDTNVEEPPRKKISTLDDKQLLSLISRINATYDAHIGSSTIEELVMDHKALHESIATPGLGPTVIRHLRQNASILGHIKNLGGFDCETQTCYVEFGAGKGQLSRFLVEAIEKCDKSHFLLIDRGARRHQYDAKLRSNKDLNIERLRIDIQHLDLSKVVAVSDSDFVISFGKHLCGGATDLSLRCLGENTSLKRSSILIALCCHHCCSWQSYVGKKFYKNANFKEEEFYLLLGLSSWAVCAAKEAKVSNDQENELVSPEHDLDKEIDDKKMENRYSQMGLTISEREEIGYKVKRLLDYGRIKYLENIGYKAKLIKYATKEMTLENIAIVAELKKINDENK